MNPTSTAPRPSEGFADMPCLWNRFASVSSIAVTALVLAQSLASGAELRLLPPSVRLQGPHARQRFVVERTEGDVGTADLSARAVFATDNPRVAVVDREGFVRPVGDGLATI